ncbi:MAG: hypothetical protein A2312_03730 [Candidatus Staskawiczbacteria bacterium RIFOXYB2_FULL_32_9]|uniref:Uncharacterized protein n=1 Tax=Candidatus Staskawiczbacteria bacterium RIFOXYD1_FULL_32_13 TaxID=1802234 RepID=A0A1G2JSP1_9BACT|nr:MAG: hypothetical protein UR22_C0002G0034 [Parcubacteria group bacterium GW2011_GWC2_32_10]OGZ80206.1 MAG: hypothetical protein A2256_00210 [Candidatus Staskawiczbacteria bacterium RIFOXYA2_FULL_32_7]OGZ80758.1 MAG: hypothetical protein A2360_02535 [Candidatus Staskawiczbacteria bacterium RIFOXYB1_FULL_32_11]OGZ82294.1 MAG: hypothetical protein A2312_03730 [Candidatus Staskawiczbacteria bacterium RIFOXYB2_FULL_32_9]OGZ86877.1 MAG: hypothetical protein A2463_01865 [Candidatus Staskawiczbacter
MTEKFGENLDRLDLEEIKRRERISRLFEFSKENLEEKYGIKDLSNIEAVKLRQIVEECEKMEQEQITTVKPESDTSNIIEIEFEAPARWLWDMYGIDANRGFKGYDIYDETTEEKFEFNNIKDTKKKIQELIKLNHKFFEIKHINDYIRRIREKAHHEF